MEEKINIPDTNIAPPPNVEMKVANYRAYRLVHFILGFIEVLLALRFLFKMLGANPQNVFAILVYSISSLFMLPFTGLFGGAAVTANGSARVLEPSIIIAMIVYALLAFGIAKLILILKSKPTGKA